jgi:hypothetical protein
MMMMIIIIIIINPCSSVSRPDLDAPLHVSGCIFRPYYFLASAWLRVHENVRGRLTLCRAAVSLPKVGPWHTVNLCFCALQCASHISHATPWAAASLVMFITSHCINKAAYRLSGTNPEELCIPTTTMKASKTCTAPSPDGVCLIRLSASDEPQSQPLTATIVPVNVRLMCSS